MENNISSNDSIDLELEKITNESTIKETKLTDDELLQAYRQSEQLTLIPILKLIYETIGLDLSKDYSINIPLSALESKNIPIGEIEINKINNPDIKYKIYLDLVDKNYDLNNELQNCKILSDGCNNLMDETNKELKNQLIQIITYLTQSAKIVFDSLKKKYIDIIEFNIQMDNNTTIFLDNNIDLRLGIKFKNNLKS